LDRFLHEGVGHMASRALDTLVSTGCGLRFYAERFK
jgi:hypothetical protein